MINTEKYDFSQHPLRNKDEYAQSMYLKFLISLARVEENNQFYDGIISIVTQMKEDMNLDISLSEISKQSSLISERDLNDFSKTINNVNLEELFIIDALIFVKLLKNVNDKVIEYIIGLSEILGISQNKLQQIIKLSKIILEEDRQGFKDMMYEVVDINASSVRMYTKSFSEIYVINDYSEYEKIKYDDDYTNVVFANINKVGGDINSTITDQKKIAIINCDFSNCDYEYAIFDCEKVIIKNSRFHKFSDLVFRIYDCEQVKFIDCYFKDCIQDEESYCNDSATLYLSDINTVRINNCKFKNCHSIPDISLESLGSDGVIKGSTAIARIENVKYFRIEDCEFINCITNRNRDGEGVLFSLEDTECKKAIRCSRVNCCDIGDKRLGNW